MSLVGYERGPSAPRSDARIARMKELSADLRWEVELLDMGAPEKRKSVDRVTEIVENFLKLMNRLAFVIAIASGNQFVNGGYGLFLLKVTAPSIVEYGLFGLSSDFWVLALNFSLYILSIIYLAGSLGSLLAHLGVLKVRSGCFVSISLAALGGVMIWIVGSVWLWGLRV